MNQVSKRLFEKSKKDIAYSIRSVMSMCYIDIDRYNDIIRNRKRYKKAYSQEEECIAELKEAIAVMKAFEKKIKDIEITEEDLSNV